MKRKKEKISPYAYVGLNFRQIDEDYIVQVVSEELDISVDMILSKQRSAQFVEARHICMHIIRDKCKELTLKQIGRAVGKTDHATVLHGIRQVERYLQFEKSFVVKYDRIMGRLEQVGNQIPAKVRDSKDPTIGEFYYEYMSRIIVNKPKSN